MNAESGHGDGKERHLHAVGEPVDAEPSRPAHFLAESHEFLVDNEDGTPFGIVDDVVLDWDGSVLALLVSTGGFNRGRVTAIAPPEILEIRPIERRIVISRNTEPPRRRGWSRRGG